MTAILEPGSGDFLFPGVKGFEIVVQSVAFVSGDADIEDAARGIESERLDELVEHPPPL